METRAGGLGFGSLMFSTIERTQESVIHGRACVFGARPLTIQIPGSAIDIYISLGESA